jgi:DNA gyrase subunit A
MTLANEARGVLVGAFIVEDGDEILSITQGGQVVRSPINADFRPMGRSTQGVKFVSPKGNDSVAVVTRSVEAAVVDDEGENGVDNGAEIEPENGADGPAEGTVPSAAESPVVAPDATIEESGASQEPDEPAPQED